ncbi:MAG: hypothetical protein LBQ89_00895 [Treponema sp.]|jgi:hypothetical protein|nr:hypothetical protein [Treponema sp.]
MKKILVVLLVLAVAGGAFAQQGSWDISGNAKVGTILDFNTSPIPATGDSIDGEVSISYSLNGLSASIGFHAFGAISGSAEYEGNNYKFKVAGNLLEIDPTALSGSDVVGIGTVAPGELWGYYKLVGGMIHLEAAYKGRDNGWWSSNDTATLVADVGFNWANLNGGNGLLAAIEIANLSGGIILPNLFDNGVAHPLMDDVFKKLIFGFKIDMDPINFAGQFKVENYGVYIGAEAKFAMLTFGLSFLGTFETAVDAGVGLKIAYDADPLSAYIGVAMGLKGDPLKTNFVINPGFAYKVIPDYLLFKVDAKFGIGPDDALTWNVEPGVFWNFRGSGANDDPGTGFLFKYKLAGGNSGTTDNNLFIGFKWNFF